MKNEYENWSKEDLIGEVKKQKRRKRYGIVWEDKPENVELFCKDNLPVLDEIKVKEILTDKNLKTNLLIEGDNYYSLSCLGYTHQNKIDVIYIDPPYNTGNKDFIYNDDFVDPEDSYKHSKWLSFMSKRLRLAKNLLRDSGVIMVSIDENEAHQLKLLCDEIYGETNKLSTHHIQVRYADKTLNEKNDWQPVMEYVFIYAKNANLFRANKPKEDYSIDKFIYSIDELSKGTEVTIKGRKVTIFKKGEWKITKQDQPSIQYLKETWVSGSIYTGTGNGTMVQNVIEPRVNTDGYGSLYKIEGLGEDGLGYRYFSGPKSSGATRCKMYSGVPLTRTKELENGESHKYKSISNYHDFSPDFGNIRHEGGIGFNSGKKPVKLLKQLINYHKNNKGIILDFFAGSGSTAQAVLELNNEDGGARTFILCTNNEGPTKDDSIAETICYPRIKNVIKGYSNYSGLGGNLKYYKCSFISSRKTDSNKAILTKKAINMLCIKENAFNPVEDTEYVKIFENNEKYLAILLNVDHVDGLKKQISGLKKPVNVYIFSLSNDLYEEEFEEFGDKVTVSPIPEAIYKVYKRIFQ